MQTIHGLVYWGICGLLGFSELKPNARSARGIKIVCTVVIHGGIYFLLSWEYNDYIVDFMTK